MSFIDFPVFEISSDDMLVVKDKSKESVDLVVVVKKEDYKDKYTTNLSQLIAAVKLDESKNVVIILLEPNTTLQLHDVYRMYRFVHCVTFGLEPKTLSLNLDYRPYQLVNFEHYQLLQVDRLNELMENGKLKKALWLKLKEMYKL